MRGNNYARYTASHKFGRPIAATLASDAIREGEALRQRLAGRRVLEAMPIDDRNAARHNSMNKEQSYAYS